jgi:hypothetical protein
MSAQYAALVLCHAVAQYPIQRDHSVHAIQLGRNQDDRVGQVIR